MNFTLLRRAQRPAALMARNLTKTLAAPVKVINKSVLN